MTDIKWRPAIAVDGKRPGWLGDDDKCLPHWEGEGWYDEDKGVEGDCVTGWSKVTMVRLPADHPHYRQTEEAPIDWSGELEAVHEDGRVVPMKLAPGVFQPERGLYTTESGQVEWGVDNRWWKPDGKHNWRDSRWRIRNVPQPTPQADTKPDLTARMEALVRYMEKGASNILAGYPAETTGLGHAYSEARAIAALLTKPEAAQPFDVPRAPCMTISEVREMVAKGEDAVIATMLERGYALPEPVDEDLIEAREIAAETVPSWTDAQRTKCRSGEYDGNLFVVHSLAGIKRGRALALAGEKEA